MSIALKASKKGLGIIDLARKKKGWTKIAVPWRENALVGEAALRKFWRRIPIRQDNFVSICQAVGVDNWEEIVEQTLPLEDSPSSELKWLLELRATLEEIDKPLIDKLVAQIQKCSPNAIIKTQKLDSSSLLLIEDWQSVESILSRKQARSISVDTPALENSIRRAKEIDLGGNHAVALVVQTTLESETEVGICVWVYPTNNAAHLPPYLQVIVLDESESIIMEEQTGDAEDSVELEFSVEPTELFSIKIIWGDVSITEDF
jgi:hypothetical protein